MLTLSTFFDFNTMIWGMFAGICLAALYAFYIKCILGNFVRALLDSGARDAMTAKSVEELGYAKNRMILNALKPKSSLRKCLSVSDTDPEKYFIPDENAESIERRFADKGTTFWHVLLTAGLFMVLVLICSWLIPMLVDMLESAVSNF